ncbi:xylulokinase [Metabacillus litoralis]|uniref:xylulokinase n=1 Tax=Metabacillus litoralis TaxID=152268 RepID=UPI001CFCE5CD|nr:xylulokinase [Metabacillus litoralis]
MSYFLGIDLGTSSVKTCLIDQKGKVLSSFSEPYQISTPNANWAEQDPDVWWIATKKTIQGCLAHARTSIEVTGIGLSGQMHGLVMVDKSGEVIRPAIIWCDQRSQDQINFLYETLPQDIGLETLNAISPGFLLPSLIWVKQHEPIHYERIDKVMLPKDFIRYRLTNEIGTDTTDGCGTLIFNPSERSWAKGIIRALDLDMSIFPVCREPYEIAGYVTSRAAKETGLKIKTPVVFGGGDQPMQAVGNGIISPGTVSCTIGTGGQLFSPISKPKYDENFRTNTFCHVRNWYLLGANLSAGLSLKWLMENVINEPDFTRLNDEVSKIPPGSEKVLYLPYLNGDRTPNMDPKAKAIFFGLQLKHNRYHLARAVMEGVAFSLRDSLEIFHTLQVPMSKIIASGGILRSELWLQILADVFQRNIYRNITKEPACLGAAIMAAVGTKKANSLEEAVNEMVKMDNKSIEPQNENSPIYEEQYMVYRHLYKQNQVLF